MTQSAPQRTPHTDRFAIRETPIPGDLGDIVALHGRVYEAEYGFDTSFEPYVAGPLSDFMIRHNASGDAAGRLWVVETSPDADEHGQQAQRVAGSIAIVLSDDGVAVLRWFVLAPEARGCGLGRELMARALEFARGAGAAAVELWTFDELAAALALYERFGFAVIEQKKSSPWGRPLTELRMRCELA